MQKAVPLLFLQISAKKDSGTGTFFRKKVYNRKNIQTGTALYGILTRKAVFMTEKELRRRQLQRRKARRKHILERLAVFIAVCLIAVVVICAGILPRVGSKKAEQASAEAETSAPLTIYPVISAEPGRIAEPTPHPYNTYTGSSDRADFAVNPAIPCGNNEISGEKIVYLTLDDGPSYLTASFLDVLDEYGIKATFFVTAQSPEYFYMIKEAYDRGHTIGLHSYSHDYATVYSSVDAFFNDLDQIGKIVEEQIGYVPCFIRFPGGSANYISHDYTPGIMTELAAEVQARGYQYFDWNCSSGDGAPVENPQDLINAATNPQWDTIVLLSHDSGGKETTLQALPSIIEYYLSNGYEFRPLTRDAYTSHQEIFN